LLNYCNSFGIEGSGGKKMGVQENLQVEDVVLVSFLTYLLQIDGFQIFVEVAAYISTTFC
jgi:hypothetical protein